MTTTPSGSSALVVTEPIARQDRNSPVRGVLSQFNSSLATVISFYHRRQILTSVTLLAVMGLLIHSAWLTSRPLSAGDWTWISRPEASSWFPWRSLWDSSAGLGDKLFANSTLAPLLSVAGLLSRMGLGWGIVEKLLFFWPFAILSLVAPWLFARTILRSSGWAFVAVPIFALNTSLIIDGSGHLSLGMAEVIALLVLAAFLVALSRLSLRWSIFSGLLLGLEAIYEIRIAYLTVLLAGLYVIVLALAEPRTGLRRLVLSLLGLVAFVGTQAFWFVPLLTYKSDPGLPLASSPWIPFSRLANGVTGVHPWWTGGPLAIFHTSPLNPVQFLLPIVAFVPLLFRRIRPEVVWLSLAALLGAFLLKQDNPPVGELYDWFFKHFPGWGLFRDASKLYFIVALSYAVLVPIGIRWALQTQTAPVRNSRLFRLLPRSVLVAVLVITCLPIFPLVSGQIGYTTQATNLPSAFAELGRQLGSDKNYGPVLWLGGAVVRDNNSDHYFRIASPTHPLLELSGSGAAGDPLASFCPTPGVPYCYLDDQLFPYLLGRTGAAYVVSPESPKFGALPLGISWQWLDGRLRSILGSPNQYGTQDGIAVWPLPRHSPVESAPAVALVNGPSQVTGDVLPSLKALKLPVVYREGGSSHSLAGPSAIPVIPALNHACRVESRGQFVVLAPTTKPSIDIVNGQSRLSVGNILSPNNLPGWGVYGPITAEPGQQLLPEADLSVPACLAWTPMTEAVLRGEETTKEIGTVSLQAELVAATRGNEENRWLELRRAYDPGWILNSNASHFVGDGLFNLYLPTGATAAAFRFSTGPWEERGAYVSIGWTLLFLFAAWRLRRERKLEFPPGSLSVDLLDVGARYAALVGLAFLGAACVFDLLAWHGAPSQMPMLYTWIISATGDPYNAYEYYVGLGFFALLLAAAFRMVGLIPRNWLGKR